MTQWDGRGLPASAAARLGRARSGARTSLLGVPSAVALSDVGLTPAGDVMGAIVQHLGWQGFGGCGYYGGAFGASTGYLRTTVSSSRTPWSGYRPYVDALYRGYDTALARLVGEAQALGAAGVVDVRLTAHHAGQGNREFTALGTAVRADAPLPPSPFVTDLPGPDVAMLLRWGWVPAGIAIGISVAVRHDDYRTRQQSRRWSDNVEVSGYTELVQHVRADARKRFAERIDRFGADGAVVSSMGLHVWEHEPSDNHVDHVAEATVAGTALAQFSTTAPAPSRALSILPLKRV